MRTRKIILIIVALLGIFVCDFRKSVFAIEEKSHCECCKCHENSTLPKVITDGTELTIQDCISIGLKNSPNIKKKKYDLDIAKSNIGIAKSVYFPIFGAGVGYGQINNSNNKYLQSLYRELPNVGVNLHKMIWDFGRSSALIKMEEFYKIGAEYEFMDSVCTTVFDIKTKYYDVLRAQSLLEIKKLNLSINSNLISNISRKVKSGTAEEADLLNAQTQQYIIQSDIIECEDLLKNSIENLNNSMYFVGAPDYKLVRTGSYEESYKDKSNPYKFVSNKKPSKFYAKAKNDSFVLPSFTYDEAVEIAYKNSPDLKVLFSTKKAMEQSLLAIKRSYYPELSGDVGYNFVNTNRFSNNDLTLGVNISSSLNAMELKHSLKGASAHVKSAENEIEKFKQDLYFQVRKSLNIVNKSKEQIPLANEQLKKAEANFEKTINLYNNGKKNQLELLYARCEYISAMENCVEKIYNYNIALINLEISMHYHLIDIHDRTEHAIKYHDEDIIDKFDNIMDCDKHDNPKKDKKNSGK